MEILKDKKFLIGGLAVLGGLALLAWYRKPKLNSEGFYNAIGSGANDTRPDFGFFANVNGICTFFANGVNADGSKAFYKAPSNGSDIFALVPIKGKEFYSATKLPKCYIKSRKEFIDELYKFNNFAKRSIPKSTYDQFSDAELKMIYDVDIKKKAVTPEYVTMLKKHGWA